MHDVCVNVKMIELFIREKIADKYAAERVLENQIESRNNFC